MGQVDGVRRFNTGVALNPLFEILKASALNKQQDGDIVVRQAQQHGSSSRPALALSRMLQRVAQDGLRCGGLCSYTTQSSPGFACPCVDHSQIGDEEDGVTSALWDLQRHQGDTPFDPFSASLLEGLPPSRRS